MKQVWFRPPCSLVSVLTWAWTLTAERFGTTGLCDCPVAVYNLLTQICRSSSSSVAKMTWSPSFTALKKNLPPLCSSSATFNKWAYMKNWFKHDSNVQLLLRNEAHRTGLFDFNSLRKWANWNLWMIRWIWCSNSSFWKQQSWGKGEFPDKICHSLKEMTLCIFYIKRQQKLKGILSVT